MIKNKKIAFVAAHFDDLEIACGGTIAKLNKNNDINIFIICDSEFKDINNKIIRNKKTALREGLSGLKALGIENKITILNIKTFDIQKNEKKISKQLIKHNKKINFDIIFTHWREDVHPDHRNLNLICNSVFKNTKSFIEFSSNYFNDEFKSNIYFEINSSFEKKIESIKEHKSEMKRTKYKWIEYFKNQCKNDGIRFDEGFIERFYARRFFI
mgnify:CR=1 FL=1|tara:strand:- start:237 stop:875 length:639 start_codon:yes stop_codon:yes gene_type:complete